jgi:PD-(D/E)XK nuclease superfamily
MTFITSVTELYSFRTCRRRWYLETIQRMAPKSQVTWYLIFGDCVHAALEAYYTPVRGKKPPRKLGPALVAFKAAWSEKDAWLREEYGPLYKMGIGDEWNDHLVKGEQMLIFYDQFDKSHPLFDSVLGVGVEERGFVPILDPTSGEAIPGAWLTGKIDVEAEVKYGVRIVDHKALASAHSSRALDIDDQLTGYNYIYYRNTDEIPFDSYYNVLVKSPPEPPRVLKNGNLSQDKSQRTTWELYHQTILDMALPVSDYEEILEYLERKGWAQFYLREGVQRNFEQMESFENHLFHTYNDMQLALNDENLRYPNPSQYTCPGCPVMAICQTMEEQGDVDYIIEEGYRIQEPRYTLPKGAE